MFCLNIELKTERLLQLWGLNFVGGQISRNVLHEFMAYVGFIFGLWLHERVGFVEHECKVENGVRYNSMMGRYIQLTRGTSLRRMVGCDRRSTSEGSRGNFRLTIFGFCFTVSGQVADVSSSRLRPSFLNTRNHTCQYDSAVRVSALGSN